MDMQVNKIRAAAFAGTPKPSKSRQVPASVRRCVNSWKRTSRLGGSRAKRLAQLDCLLKGPQETLTLFLLFWDKRGEVISHEEVYGAASRRRPTTNPNRACIDAVLRVRRMIKAYAFPLVIENVKFHGWRMHLKEPDWSWEDLPFLSEPEVEAATDFMASSPNCPRHLGFFIGILLSSLNRTVLYSDIARRYGELYGRKRLDQKETIGMACRARTLLDELDAELQIERIGSVGYRMVGKGGGHPTSTIDVSEAVDIYDLDNVAAALDYLGHTWCRVAELFLILWSRRGSTVSFERLEEELYSVTGDVSTRDAMDTAIRMAAAAAASQNRSLSIKNQRGIGFRLDHLGGDDGLPAELAAIPAKVDHADMDTLARFVDRFPGARPGVWPMLQVFLDAKGMVLDRQTLCERVSKETGRTVTGRNIQLRLRWARRFLEGEGAPVRIVNDMALGWYLEGDLAGWLAGKAPKGPGAAKSVTPAPEPVRKRSIMVPQYRTHIARCAGGYR